MSQSIHSGVGSAGSVHSEITVPLNAYSPMEDNALPDLKDTLLSELQDEYAYDPMVLRVAGKVMLDVVLLQNAYVPMLSRRLPDSKLMDAKELE